MLLVERHFPEGGRASAVGASGVSKGLFIPVVLGAKLLVLGFQNRILTALMLGLSMKIKLPYLNKTSYMDC